ncbi:MAG: type II 3-dehydroquinate dehydratase [Candidatus Eremiobacteraeota bacterium]|nr:type II 3-dehydroquinate dehydratase [Candidatus Eremiobacteraeota bacterium]
MRALVINGPNLNLLGSREPDVYGRVDYAGLVGLVEGWANELGLEVVCFQSNFEGEILDRLQLGDFDFAVLNPGALTHTSVALRDAISAVGKPAYEVHISNIYARETFRHHSTISPVCVGVLSGFGLLGYKLALTAGGQP